MRNTTPHRRGLGWRPDLPDHRDMLYGAPHETMRQLPPSVDLRQTKFMPPIYEQGTLGSCCGNAVAGAMQFIHAHIGHPDAARVPSRLMIYFCARRMEGTIREDAGAEIRDAIKSVVKFGACWEDGDPAIDSSIWRYDPAAFALQPPDPCFLAAKKFKALEYRRVPQISQQLRSCLAEGHPFVFGFTVYPELDSDEVAKTGILPMPNPRNAPIGGHAVICVGYDDNHRRFIVRNSWGENWALNGYYFMPYEYLLRSDLASDFWTIRTTS